MSALAAAMHYARCGWRPIPIPFRSKSPGFSDWQRLQLSEADIPNHFNCKPQNVGILLGAPSRWLVDVDLDHELAIELADSYLPPTNAVFGRASKPRSHWLYHVSTEVVTQRCRSRSAGMIVELRSTGCQTVFPPSFHESGEPIEWEAEDGEPAAVAAEQLVEAVNRLATRVRYELGELSEAKTLPTAGTPASPPFSLSKRRDLCLDSMLRLSISDSKDGSSRLFAATCRAVEHDLDDQTAIAIISEYSCQRPFPREWTDTEILARIRDAEAKCTRGKAIVVARESDDRIAPGSRDPQTGKLVLTTNRTLPTAHAYLEEFQTHPLGRTLWCHCGLMREWRRNRFEEVEDDWLRHQLQPWLNDAAQYVLDRATGEQKLVPFPANPTTVEAALKSIRMTVHLPATLEAPAWLDDDGLLPRPEELLCYPSGTLHVPTGVVLEPTPKLFNTNAIEFDFDPHATAPTAWLEFLDQLWGDDHESKCLLQEWMGYSIVADTSQQKMLLIVGPKRAGKGTIGRVLAKLVGAANVAGPTVSSLGGSFGLQPLLGKSLAIVSDARFAGEHIGVVTERLLCISGEDTLTIDRKHIGSVTTRLPTRFVFLTNELPRMNDASGALASRFLILRLTQSFYGAEDPQLSSRLFSELPGILLWAVEGLKRLRERGHFVQPSAVAEAVRDLEDLASPVAAFVRECCEVAVGSRVWVDDLYGRWKTWCEDEGRTCVSNKQTFGRDLSAAVPGVTRRRGGGNTPFYDGITLRGSEL